MLIAASLPKRDDFSNVAAVLRKDIPKGIANCM